MASTTKIAWATASFSPWLGCTKTKDPGCRNCYAAEMAGRLGVTWGVNGTRRRTAESTWKQIEKWNRKAACIHPEICGHESGHAYGHCPQHDRPRVFPSLCDIFEDWQGPIIDATGKQVFCCDHHSNCPPSKQPLTMDRCRRDFFALIDRTPNLDWLLLTKRPQNIRPKWTNNEFSSLPSGRHPRENVWLLYSASDQASLDAGLPHLLACRDLVPVLGLSLEPLIGPIELNLCPNPHDVVACDRGPDDDSPVAGIECPSGRHWVNFAETKRNCGLDWCIAGGESGPHYRPMELTWLQSLADQCSDAGVPLFVKQDAGRKPGQQGRIPDELWSRKEFPR